MPTEWFTAAEIAGAELQGIPSNKWNVILMAKRLGWDDPAQEGVLWRPRIGRGGGREYHIAVFPPYVRQQMILRNLVVNVQAEHERSVDPADVRATERWAWWARQSDVVKDRGKRRLLAIQALERLMESGTERRASMHLVCNDFKITLSTLYNWEGLIAGVQKHHRMAFLTPCHVGRTSKADCSPEAWEMVKGDYLRAERPNFTDCYRRAQKAAAEKGWTIPSEDTLLRRIRKLPVGLVTKEREGEAALKALYPHQVRDRSVFHALQGVNADGHKWDLFVKWPDGDVSRVVMVVFQDLYSGKMLSWRVDRTENRECVRLAFGDMIEKFGIPDECYLDNGRNFASKWLTGGTKTRFRFKVRDDEPEGIMTQLGVNVHWTTPYSGQSKPIERGFRDFAQSIAKHPAFAGAWTGNSPMNKPENYASGAVPLELFLKIAGECITEHNARLGRRSVVCAGKASFDQVFEASYLLSAIRKASPDQRRLWLMAADKVLVQRDGAVILEGNRFANRDLHEYRGQRVVARFDPEALHEPLHIYTLAGHYICAAECLQAIGFNDVAAAREHGRKRREWMRAIRTMAAAEKSMLAKDVAAVMDSLQREQELEAPETKVVRPVFKVAGALARKPESQIDEEPSEFEAMFVRAQASLRAERGGHLRLIGGDDE